jgi:thioesterase domain-containing protein
VIDPTVTKPQSELPVLFSVRGWPAEVNPAYITFVDEMRSTGVEVIDVYVGPKGFETHGQWATAVADAIESHDRVGPLHVMSYCLGGAVAQVALGELSARGIEAEFVAFIDVRHESPSFRLERGLDSLYNVPWGFRIRHQLLRLTPPESESLRKVVSSVMRRSMKSLIELPKRGWRSHRRIQPWIHTEMLLGHRWEFSALLTPIHLYNTTASIEKYGKGDPTVHLGRYLWGGFVVRRIAGNHENCIEPPHSAGLIERITADRSAVVSGVGAFQ